MNLKLKLTTIFMLCYPGALRHFVCALALTIFISPAFSEEFAVTSGLSAHWFNPDRSGEGLVLEILGDETALLYWFTYDEEGGQRWLIDVGGISGDEITFPELTVTRGGQFGPDFNSDDVEYEVAGEAILRFSDCDHGKFNYSAFGQSETISVVRLSQTMAAGCQPLHGVPGQPVHQYAGQSGSWYDLDHSGEGYTLQWLSRDEALLVWFSYDPKGNQYWMIGSGNYNDGVIEFPMLHSTQGGHFGSAFDPEEVKLIEWGSLTLDIDCASGTASYESSIPEFGSGGLDLDRLTNIGQLACPWVRPGLTDLHGFEIQSIPVGFDGAPPGLRVRDVANGGTVVGWAPNETIWRWQPGEEVMSELPSDSLMRDPLVSAEGARIIASAQAPAVANGRAYGPMLWSDEAGWRPLGENGFDRSRALSLSASGDIIVGVGRNWDNPVDTPWVWAPELGQVILLTTPEAALSAPLGVSDDATIVAGSALNFSPMRMQAIRWVEDNEPEFLHDHLGYRLGGVGECDSSCNVIVGAGQADDIPDHPHRAQAWYWKGADEMGYLGSLPDALLDLPGAPYAPSGISADGAFVVGRYLRPTFQGGQGSMGFLWTQVTGLESMTDILDQIGLRDESWLEMEVRISPQGNLLLLEGTSQRVNDPEPRRRAYLLRMFPSELRYLGKP